MTHDVHDSPYAWLRLLIATIANVGIWAVVVILPDVEAEFGASRAAASAPYTLTVVGFAAGNLVIGRLVDRFGLVAFTFRSLNSFVQPFVRMPRGFCYLAMSDVGAGYKSH